MSGPVISDHALVRFLERGGDLDLEALRHRLSASLARAHSAARSIGSTDYLIRADGLIFCVRHDTVTTVLDDSNPHDSARALRHWPT